MVTAIGFIYIEVFNCKSLGDLKKCENMIMDGGEIFEISKQGSVSL